MFLEINPHLLAVLALGLSTTACDDTPVDTPAGKGVIDRSALEAGVVVTLAPGLGTVELPFAEPVPEAEDGLLESELSDAVWLDIMSTESGTTANLASGTIVESSPASPGEWAWELNPARDLATMTFFNETSAGLTLKESVIYAGGLSITSNEFVEEEEFFGFEVTVVEGG